MLKNLPRLSDLQDLITRVPRYPITASQLVDFAAQSNANSAVINFYRTFPNDVTFYDEDDLEARSEQVDIMKSEIEEQPKEVLAAPEED